MNRFELMQTFVRVVEAGSLSAAADRMAIAKSVASRRLRELEEYFGVRLLNRTTRRLSLTESGRHYYERSIRILTDLEEAEQAISSEQTELRGRLRLAAPFSFGLLHLMPVLDDFMREHAGLILDLDLNDRNINLVEEGFDLAIRIGRLVDSTLVARRLAPIRMVACASPDYLDRHGEPRTPEELIDHQGMVYSNIPESQHWLFTDNDGNSRPVKVPERMRANNGDALLQAAITGLGVTVMPTFLAQPALEQGQLQPILSDYALPVEAAYAVFPSQRYLPRRIRLFVDALVEKFGDEPYWDNWTVRVRNQG